MKRILLFGLLLAASTLPCGAQTPTAKPEIAIDVLWGASAAADVALTQNCARTRRCREANPLMPRNAGGAVAVEGAETALGMWAFHHFRATHPRLAWMIPAANVTAHAVGIWSWARGQ